MPMNRIVQYVFMKSNVQIADLDINTVMTTMWQSLTQPSQGIAGTIGHSGVDLVRLRRLQAGSDRIRGGLVTD